MQTSHHHLGDGAVARLLSLGARAFDDDATGGVYGYRREGGTPAIVRIGDPSEIPGHLDRGDLEMIVVDSGNSDGDAWKYVYHVATRSGMEVDENPVQAAATSPEPDLPAARPLSDELARMAARHAALRREDAQLADAVADGDDEAIARAEAIAAEIDSMHWRLGEIDHGELAPFAKRYEGVDPETLPNELCQVVIGVRGLLR